MKTYIIITILYLAFATWIGADLYNKHLDRYVKVMPKCQECPDCVITIDTRDTDLTHIKDIARFILPDIKGLEVQIGNRILKDL